MMEKSIIERERLSINCYDVVKVLHKHNYFSIKH